MLMVIKLQLYMKASLFVSEELKQMFNFNAFKQQQKFTLFERTWACGYLH
jgi:hypothetical protein